jgi:hypothetical protein
MKGLFPHIIDGKPMTRHELAVSLGLKPFDILCVIRDNPSLSTSAQVREAVVARLRKPRWVQRPNQRQKRWNNSAI